MKPATLFVLAPVLFSPPASAQVGDLGEIDFPNSGAPEVQEDFIRGVLLLHSFEYDDAAECFRAAQEKDPDFLLAYWGEAMTNSKPIWGIEDREAAQEVLNRLGATPEERRAKADGELELALLGSVEMLFGEGERMDRHDSYSAYIGELHRRYPENLEVASFYALSILGTSRGGREIPKYMRAAAVAEEVFQKNPRHPGALHYLIHSYDDPVHAPLGLRMARIYAQVAPAAAHALHMPSHIFVALGMWDESAASNEESAAAADARRATKELSIEERGFHSLWWLAYTYLQQGRWQRARELLADMQRDARESGSRRTRTNLVAMRAAHVITTGQWEGDAVAIEVDSAEMRLTHAVADAFVTGLAAVERRELDQARESLDLLRAKRGDEVLGALPTVTDASCCLPFSAPVEDRIDPELVTARVMELELDGVISLAEGEVERALELLVEAVETEDAQPFDFGPPDVVKPAHELLGEVLLGLDRPVEAAREFEQALARAPGRLRALLGLARALERAGEPEASRAVYARLRANLHAADEDLPLRAEVWRKSAD